MTIEHHSLCGRPGVRRLNKLSGSCALTRSGLLDRQIKTATRNTFESLIHGLLWELVLKVDRMGEPICPHVSSCAAPTSAAKLDERSLFWQSLVELAATTPAVLKMVLNNMGYGAANRLRRVNRAMRSAVNRTVSTVRVDVHGPTIDGRDLAVVFEEANALRVKWNTQPADAAEVAIFLSHIFQTSPLLVAKIHTLTMELRGMPRSTSLAGFVAEFLSRCAP